MQESRAFYPSALLCCLHPRPTVLLPTGSQQPQAWLLLVTLHVIPEERMKQAPGIWKLKQEDQDFKTNLGNLDFDSKQEK